MKKKALSGSEPAPLLSKVGKMVSRGEITAAAVAVSDAKPNEKLFDAIMATYPAVREAFLKI
jgi:hypothetical protein